MALRLGDIAPDITQESAKFLKGCKELRPSLRMAPQPNKIMAESRYAACAS